VKIPKKVKVGGLHYTVKCEKDVSDGRLSGLADHNDLVMLIERCAPEQMFDTFLHESLHSISHTYHIGLTEDEVCVLAPALHAFLKDNRLLKD
jgi:hypothetical protein